MSSSLAALSQLVLSFSLTSLAPQAARERREETRGKNHRGARERDESRLCSHVRGWCTVGYVGEIARSGSRRNAEFIEVEVRVGLIRGGLKEVDL